MIDLVVETKKLREVVDITPQIEQELKSVGEGEGMCTIFVKHTTCAVTTADLDPGTDKDMIKAFGQLIPKLDYIHPHDPTHVQDHILATLIGPSVCIPFKGSKLKLGKWQRVVLIEFNGPAKRNLVFSFDKESLGSK
ncbi:MAG: hypothetical protein ACD_52C00275G0003 [uncultured bacterium]|uniref:Secondary thiamine-phosphate synthase enzyme n=1 Tax=Candidatus Woesebacteria bacterium RIFCSPHIGHO2_12_FULL_41_24 TaxID=1802510 RepID=A0A1F8AUR6_9BACT|nr:MAG: hypothetical protein ACD_52C00275G0003 [uncultured bacterium]OGM14827.1 MAG: hypothetical protein A2W15_00615 [Candidatus Woesebacteria bacterium RBG_16_41_13]OGM30319.1 MAG: hypothetical protein A2873_05320 [Candidatus Woesebacteria bacterium RIFCSPHIGHO2_01_FULL_42_80]OGM34358.1 MAG: hypothetical protein A3D84_04900 [Candidatus Woesebacteria bacterium RIFCSPHIGHO2_02_FULL_42_20]OGM55492.1 MAG: hypothetical protein A3E44_01055 [Candidatus Woesebacteria bacterium RIFCSPHIGHO2_12_FULL_41